MKKSSSWGRKIKRFFLWALLFFFGSTIGITILYSFVNPPITPLMLIRLFDKKYESPYRLSKQWTPMASISPHYIQAVIAAEDNLFAQHNGFDWKAIQEAQKYNQKHKGKKMRGASTISQQTAKNVFLWPQRSFVRKGLEVYFTGLIELFWSKKRIMEVYLNVIELGRGIYGVEKASEIYFRKEAAAISRSEAALLVACVPDPRRRRPDRPTSYLFKRQGQILVLMNQVEPFPSKSSTR